MMSEPGEELQESQLNPLRSRSGRVTAESIDSLEDYQEMFDNDDHGNNQEEDYEALCQTLNNLLEDLTACDVQLSLFIAASSSYRQDTTLRPFPPMFLEDQVKDLTSLASLLDQLPSLEKLRRDLKAGKLDLEMKLVQLIVWVLRGGSSNLKLRTLTGEERAVVADCAGMRPHPQPQYILEVNTRTSARWIQAASQGKTHWAFHGSRLDNFYSILHYGLQQHLNKTGLFGEGIYLCEDLGVCLTYSTQGLAWTNSSLGQAVSCVVMTEVVDHPSVKMYSQDSARGLVEGSEGGRVPDKYILVRNNDLVHIRSVFVPSYCLFSVIKVANVIIVKICIGVQTQQPGQYNISQQTAEHSPSLGSQQ